MPFQSSARGKYGPQGMKAMKGPLAPTWTTSGTLTQAQPSTAYSYQLVASDDSGDAPVYTLNTGSIPSGLSISSSGLLSGTPTQSGTFTFTVNATDTNGRSTASSTLTLVSVNPVAPAGTGQIFTAADQQTNYTFAQAGTYYVYCVGAGGQTGGGNGGGSGGVTASKLTVTAGTVFGVGVGSVGGGYEMRGGSGSNHAGGGGSYVKLVSGSCTNASAANSGYLLVAGGGGGGATHGFGANYGGNGNGQGGAEYSDYNPDSGYGGYSGWNGGAGGSSAHGGGNGGSANNANQHYGANWQTSSGNYGGAGGGGYGGGASGMSGTGGTGNAGGYGDGWAQDGGFNSYRRGGGGGGSHPSSCGGTGGGGGGLVQGDTSDGRFEYGSYRVTPFRTTSPYRRQLNEVMASLGRSDLTIGSYGNTNTQGAVWIVASGS